MYVFFFLYYGGIFFLSDERRGRWAQIRISREEDEMIKKFGMTKTEIWRIGFNEWLKNLPEKMKELADYHQKMSIQCIDKLKELKDSETTSMNLLDKFCHEYIKQGRTISQDLSEIPRQDKYWIEVKIKDYKLLCDVPGFIARGKELKDSLTNTKESSD